MKIVKGKFDPETGTMPVTFKEGRITHTRTINVVRDQDGNMDEAATKEIIDAQAAGVSHKIALGVIRSD
jgi:hypothetical protein